MKAIILAAGYATRLYPLTLNKPKALLNINDKPVIDYIVDGINEIDVIDEIIIVSNDKFYKCFCEWQEGLNNSKKITVLNDGTTSVETRLGAIGDIRFAIDKYNIDDELVVIAGDNFFTYRLLDYYNYFKATGSDCICVKQIEDKEEIKSFAVALLDEKNKVIDLAEKPEIPKSDLAAFAAYMYKKETLPLFKKYLDEGNNKDAPGFFVEWLYKIKDVYAYIMDGDCYDIGTLEALNEVDDLIRKQSE